MSNLLKFEIANVAVITSDTSNPDDLPCIDFAEGTTCNGLPRHYEEIDEMGYGKGELIYANFIHECIHLFLAHKFDYLKDSIQWRAAHGGDFSSYSEILKASKEERLVLGFQIAVNEVIGDLVNTAKVEGFTLHIAYACQEYASREIKEKYGMDFWELVREFKTML